MPVNMQAVVDLARATLNDADKVRNTDATLLKYANACINDLRNQRPDLFIGQYLASTDDLALEDLFPLEKAFFTAVSDYVIFRAESLDDEHVLSGRASMFMQLFGGRL